MEKQRKKSMILEKKRRSYIIVYPINHGKIPGKVLRKKNIIAAPVVKG